MSTLEQILAKQGALEKRIQRIETKERPLALRGWRDDFLGDAVHEQYTLLVNAGGAGALMDNVHGGFYQLSVPNAAGAYARLFLGDGAAGFSTIGMAAGQATIMIGKVGLDTLGTAQGVMGALEAGTNNLCYCGYVSSLSANWLIYSRDNAGGASWTASTIAVDTNFHWLRFEINPTILRLYVDSVLVCTHTTNLPINYLEPFWQAYRESGVLNFYLDFVAVIPMNL